MNGKQIREIRWGDGQYFRAAGENQTLFLSATHHGDHDQFWVVVERHGKEIERYRAQSLDYIGWLSDQL